MTCTTSFIAGSSPIPISRAPPPEAEVGMPLATPRSRTLEEFWVPVVGRSPPAAGVAENIKSPSRIICFAPLRDSGFIRQDRVNGPDRDATEGGDGLAVE